MDIVCPLGNGSHWNNHELRYSLRSLVMHGANIGNVIIVGEKPQWLQNVIHIPTVPTNKSHEHNIVDNLLAACNSDLIGENFLGWQDDYFLIDKIDCEKYPFYHSTLLEVGVRARLRYDGYAMSLDNSRKLLLKKNKPTFNFDIHCPIIYNKKNFIDFVGQQDWNVSNGYVIKSLYANQLEEKNAVQMPDLKINNVNSLERLKASLFNRHIFSISDKALNDTMKNFLRNSYPEKSIYEV